MFPATDSAEIVFRYFPHLTSRQKDQFLSLQLLYSFWNQRINVISRQDVQSLYLKHVLHSLGIAKVHTFRDAEHVLDVGTGGGFPGIPLAILFPGVRFHLIDSIGKKTKVVQAVIEALELKNATCQQVRAEQLDRTYHHVVSRAVAPLQQFIKWVEPCLAKQGFIFCLKGGDLSDEIAQAKIPAEVLELSQYFDENFFETKKVVKIRLP